MGKIDASSLDDVRLLAGCFLTIPHEDKWKIAGKVYDLGLIDHRGILGWLLKIVKKWKGSVGIFTFYKFLSERSPETIDSWIEDTIRHIVNGKDTTDPASVGGWSQKEINLLLNDVTFSLLRNRS